MSTHNVPFQYKKENYPKLLQICSNGIFFKGLENEFETAMVNEPTVFEPLKFYCRKSPNSFLLKNFAIKLQGGLIPLNLTFDKKRLYDTNENEHNLILLSAILVPISLNI